jgi:hypothetical protein
MARWALPFARWPPVVRLWFRGQKTWTS